MAKFSQQNSVCTILHNAHLLTFRASTLHWFFGQSTVSTVSLYIVSIVEIYTVLGDIDNVVFPLERLESAISWRRRKVAEVSD